MITLTATATLPTTNTSQLLVVYMHMDPADRIIKFIGMCKIDDLFKFNEGRANSMWPSIFLAPDKTVNVAVHSVHTIEREAAAALYDLIKTIRPICNIKGYRVSNVGFAVLCEQTGERWPTIVAAAKAHGVAASALSNHLNRKPGHKSVHGRTYRRVPWTDLQPDQPADNGTPVTAADLP